MDARDAKANQWECQPKKRRRRNGAYLAAEVEVHGGLFKQGFVGAVDQVEAPGPRANAGLDLIDGAFDHRGREAGRTKECEHAGLGHRFDDLDRADSVGHGSRQVGKAQAVVAAETFTAQVGGNARWRVCADHYPRLVGSVSFAS